MTTLRKRTIALVGALGLTLLIALTAVAGVGSASVAPGAGGTGAPDFLAKLAANLGIGQDQLTTAVKTTNLQLIDEAAAAGTLTADQAQAARDRVNNSADGGGFGGRIGGGGRSGPRGEGGMMLSEATASFFGITTDQLRQNLADTGSVQGVAAKYGKDNDTDKAALRTALETALRQQLTDKDIEAATIDARVAEFTRNFDRYYTHTGGERGPRGPQGPQPSPSAAPIN